MTVFKNKIVRAVAVAVALGGSVLTAVPAAQAQSFDFDFRFGGPGWSFNLGDGIRRGFCMNAREVRRDLRRDGYDEIRFLDRRGRIVHLVAELDRRWGRDRTYRIAYDTCRGRIVDRDRINNRRG
jgi:hypothetical protein